MTDDHMESSDRQSFASKIFVSRIFIDKLIDNCLIAAACEGGPVIEKLENNEQILLMYLAGELPTADHQEVEQMLRSDVALRRDMVGLQLAQQQVADGLERLDSLSSLPARPEILARKIGNQWRQSQARAIAARKTHSQAGQPRSWRWFYPTALAAGVAIVGMLWLSQQAEQSQRELAHVREKETVPHLPAADSDADAQLLISSLAAPSEADPMDPDPGAAKVAGDAEPKVVAAGNSEGSPQDQISQLLLSANTAEP
jgi:hypothetical protein